MQLNGAKRNTNLPHLDHFEGIIAISTRRCPAPMLSPLNIESYNREIQSLANTLNTIREPSQALSKAITHSYVLFDRYH